MTCGSAPIQNAIAARLRVIDLTTVVLEPTVRAALTEVLFSVVLHVAG